MYVNTGKIAKKRYCEKTIRDTVLRMVPCEREVSKMGVYAKYGRHRTENEGEG